MIRAAGILAIALALLGAASAQALTLQEVGDFELPTYVSSDPGNAGRLFVVERKGTIELVEGGSVTQFADLGSEVGCGASCEGERGLMSIALAPDFDESGHLYVDYANDTTGTIHVEELTAAGPDHDSASAATLRPLLEIPHASFASHNGGQLQFGPDGDLYISTGDGGGTNDPLENGQNLSSRLGKILRLDPETEAVTIWSSGLRNPFRFSFDSLTGDMVIGDVGQGAREEIDFAPSPFPGLVGGEGANYGWNCREGFLPGAEPESACAMPPAAGFVDPVFDYPHTPDLDLGGADRCAVIGGYVARDPALGALRGHYLYADLCSGALRALTLPAGAGGRASDDCSLRLRVEEPVSFGEDAAHRLYLVEQGGRVSRLAGQPPAGCPAPAVVPTPPEPPAPPEERPQLDPTYVGIKAERRRVEHGKVALLTVWVSPCDGRRGQSVELLRDGAPNGSHFLSRACTARFLPRVRRGTTFTAVTREERGYQRGESRRLTIRLAHRHR